jgi:L-lactate dehydrogenase complex protein LldG
MLLKKVLMHGIKKEKTMSSRSEILSKIKTNKPPSMELPKIDVGLFHEDVDLLSEFKNKILEVGGSIFSVASLNDIISKVESLYGATKNNYALLEGAEHFNTIKLEELNKPHELEDLDVLVLKGTFGIAENGAIWLSDDQIPIRVLPFITKHLVLVLEESKILQLQHHAYDLLRDEDYDYGLFISGPSKTADIEQSLVIGAQGALSLTVLLYKK